MKSILDSSFHYTPSAKTDLKKTFARIRRQQKEEQAARAVAATQSPAKIVTMEQVRKLAVGGGHHTL